jgi:hypothetical protein
MSMAYLGRWSGPVSETDDPYNVSFDTSPSGIQPRKHVQEVLFVPGRASATDNEGIKTAVMTYGAVYTGMYYTSVSYNTINHSYYYNGSSGSNHGVTIVGWDDNYNLNNFNTPAPGNGAFIVKNSWGTSWGDAGYFYVSYYDSRMGSQNTVFVNAESTTNYNRVYQYDPLGWVSSYGYGNTTAWGANIFTALSNENLTAVSFYTADVNTSYEIRIYKNAISGPISGTLSGSKQGSFAYAGYHTIALDATVPLSLGERFSVVVRITTSGYTYPIAVEQAVSGYSSSASSNPGESYMSINGTNWSDLTLTTNGNVCLKAFTALTITKNDFNTDGHPDLLWRNPATGENVVYYMDGVTILNGVYLPTVDPAWTLSGTADLNADGHPDLLWRNPATGENVVYYMDGVTILNGVYLPTVDPAWTLAGTADMNSDSKPDLLWRNPTTGQNVVYYMDGITILSGVYLPTVDSDWTLAGTADLNADGKPDLLWRNPATGQNVVYYMDGVTIQGSYQLFTVATPWEIVGR